MSDEPRDLYNYHDPFHVDSQYGNFGYDPSSYMSFTDCLRGSTDYNSLARAFGLSPSSSEMLSLVDGNTRSEFDARDGRGPASESNNNLATPNSSISSSSTEAGAEEDSFKSKRDVRVKEEEGGSESSTKQNKSRKKAEKREREPRFAFMTKSEVDQLEDGYRWRKYGQKAVKNSPYPRSYYRCTTQKCTVKKRVERSFQDPSTVITTYEGQHNHPIPSTLRSNSAAGMFTSSMLNPNSASAGAGPSFPHEFLLQMHPFGDVAGGGGRGRGLGGGVGSIYPQTITPPQQQQNQHHFPDYGILQDMVPSMYFKQEP